MSYDQIHYVLASYFNPEHGLPENESVGRLREHALTNPAFGAALRSELVTALGDPSFSWQEALEQHEVAFFEDEVAARAFAREHVLSAVFP